MTTATEQPTQKALDNILKAMTILITRKDEGKNGWYSKMVSMYDIRKFLYSKHVKCSDEQLRPILNALYKQGLIRWFRVEGTNFLTFGLTQKYFDLVDRAYQMSQQPAEEQVVAEQPAPAPKGEDRTPQST